MSYVTFSEDETGRTEVCYHVGTVRYHGPYANRCTVCGSAWATQVTTPPPHFRRVLTTTRSTDAD